MEYAYIRVSTVGQSDDRQFLAMDSYNIPEERIFAEKLSDKDTKRPKLQLLMSTVQAGDVVIVESISRFARNTRDLLDLVEKLTDKDVEFISLKERIDTSTPTRKFILTLFGAVAELEREYMLQNQANGIRTAKARGVKFGRPVKMPPDNFAELIRQWERGNLKFAELLAATGLKESSFFRRLREYRAEKKKL